VIHPITRQLICLNQALDQVQDVSSEIQARITQERVRLGLGLMEEAPLTQEDHDQFNANMQAVSSS